MNKKICFLLFSLVIIIGVVIGIFVFNKKDNPVWITDYEFLYDKAVEYIVEQKTKNGSDNDKNDYKVFADYEGFGIEEKGNKKIAYMWILEESYYIEGKKEVKESQGSSMPYKFIFENNEVIDYETPKDGSDSGPTTKAMLPDSIENKVLSFRMDDTKLKEQVKEYYSYLDISSETKTSSYFNGTVVEVGKTYIVVEPDKESNERKSGDKISIGTANWNTEFIVGNRVKITYDGTIMNSYPAQIHATDIELLK